MCKHAVLWSPQVLDSKEVAANYFIIIEVTIALLHFWLVKTYISLLESYIQMLFLYSILEIAYLPTIVIT